MKSVKGDQTSMQQKLSTFLFKYRTAHSLTNETPAKLLLGRNLRTRLDIIKPNLNDTVLSEQDQMKFSIRSNVRKFKEGEMVMARDYRKAEQSWIPGEIHSRTGPLSYTVDTGLGTLWRRHADQLRCGTSDTNSEPNIEIPDVRPTVPTTMHTPEGKDAIPQAVSVHDRADSKC
ncbi:uncharacterized protein LOC134259924 [Saccostrea cucullata]|uniref:uncharacterized protein LOC134259924 n=1 Tax=Saccostrea cuccullata TaxID=36930 RepID=UPI002ED5564A